MPEIAIEIQGQQRLIEGLAKLERGWIDLRRMESQLTDAFYKAETEQFSNAPWEPLDADYERRKARQFPGKSILRRTDALFNALTGPGGNSIKRVTKTEFEIGAGGEPGKYGTFHQLGTTRMPQRKVIDIDPDSFIESIVDETADFAKAEGFQVM